jgi:17beta-estradiol 17-dehydrogenase / very-long-chain 3-oxoacyl-CoA reductase
MFIFILFLVYFVNQLYKYFIRPAKDFKKFGEWAVITGATDGIGRAYAFKMASKGLSVALVSRTQEKLDAVAKEICEKYPSIKTMQIVCDFSVFDEPARTKLFQVLRDLDIGVLINNVGISYEFPKYFHELTDLEVAQLMEMNVASTTWLTHAVLPSMVKRRRGTIVNIASAAGVHTMPLLAQYSAAKGYIAMLTRGINAECREFNVSASCQTPFYVATKLAKLRKSLSVPTPEAYVDMGVRWIGHDDAVVSPFILHAVQGWFIEHLPSWFVESQILGMHKGIRVRGLKKKTT